MKAIENVGVSPEHGAPLRPASPRARALRRHGQRPARDVPRLAPGALVAAARPSVRGPVRHVHLRVHRVRGVRSTSATTREWCASRGASSRSTWPASSPTTSTRPRRPGTTTRTAASSTCTPARARARTWRASTRGSAFPTSRACTVAQPTCSARCRACTARTRASSRSKDGPRSAAPWRAACVAFFALMCFSAVYLDHHWVLDAVAGITVLHPHRGHGPRADAGSTRLASEPARGGGATARRNPVGPLNRGWPGASIL